MSTILSQVFTYKSRSSPVKLDSILLDSSLGPDDILVDTSHVALNPADAKIKSLAFVPWKYYTVRDFSGTVVSAGSNSIKKFPPGTKVCGNHQMGSATVGSITKINANKHAVMLKPKSLTDAEAAGIPAVFGTAHEMTRSCKRIDPNSSVLVLGGASSVGSLVTQLLKHEFRVRRVVSTCSASSSKYSKSIGAQETIDYHDPDFKQQLVHAAGSEKFQNIFDCVGGYDAIEIVDKILQPPSKDSTYVTVAGDHPFGQTHSGGMLKFAATVPRMVFRSIFGKSYGINYKFAVANNKVWPETGPGLIDRHRIKVPIDSIFNASEINVAIQHMDTGNVKGKVVLSFQPEK